MSDHPGSTGLLRRGPLRLAVAGTGAMARYHLARFSAIAGVRTVACYDRSRSRARVLAEEFSLQPFDDIDDLLEVIRPDALSVAVADSQHHEIAAAAIKRGIPVFLEKPFTADVCQAEHLVELQDRYRVPVLVNFSKINFPAVYGLVKTVESGGIGELRHAEIHYRQSWLVSAVWGEWWRDPRWLWRISSSHGGGGALRDLGSHLLYLALRLGGSDSVAAVEIDQSLRAGRDAARGSGYSCDMNDTFTCEITFSGGAVVRLHGTYADQEQVNQLYLRVEGSTGSVEVTAEREKDILYRLGAGPGAGIGTRAGTRADQPRRLRFSKVYSTYDAFVHHLRCGAPWQNCRPSAREGLAVQRLLSGVLP